MLFKIKIALFLSLFIILGNAGFSQQKEMKKAYAEYNDLQYNLAAEYYQKALNKTKKDSQQKHLATYMLAECYRMMNDPDRAQPYYEELISVNFGSTDPILYLRYASVLRTNGNLADAKKYYNEYLKTDPQNPEAKLGVKSCDWIMANKEKKAYLKVSDVQSINSSYDDFAPAFLTRAFDQLVFTSNRPGSKGKELDQWTGSSFSDLFTSSQSGGSWIDPVSFDLTGLINTDIHEGTPSFNKAFSAMYFTRCNRTAERRGFCQVLMTEKKDGRWTKPTVIFSDTTSNIGQPCISSDELEIIFSSDMKGGSGDHDIWIARRESKEQKFGKPENAGAGINTSGDEMFPYFYNDTTLFFSSNGFEGYGGLDIYKSVLKGKTWSSPKNLLIPINSGYDDFGIVVITLNEEGYFSSNRPAGKGGDDIYYFTRKPFLFVLSGHVKDNMTLLSMEGVEVLLINQKRDTLMMLTDEQGYYTFDSTKVLENSSYELIFRKNNYFSQKELISTKSYKDDYDFIVDKLLEPIPEKPIVLPDILYELDKWDLQPQYQDSLMQLVELLNVNENLVIELRSHTDSRASFEYNDVLSQKRAQSVVDFLITKGILPGRLIAKGYGERVPRVLNKDIVRENYLFKAGTELTDKFINSLPTNEIKEAAFQLNRRTEFAVLAKDYNSSGQSTDSGMPVIQLISDTTGIEIDFRYNEKGKIQVTCYINDYGTDAIINPESAESMIDERIVLDLLKKGAIDRRDFQGNFEEIMVENHIKENTLLKLNKLRLGEIVLDNSIARVKNDTGQLLIIGKDILGKAGKYTVDENRKRIIFK